MAAVDGPAGASEISVPLQCSRFSCEINTRRDSLASLHASACKGPSTFLAIRWVERAAQLFCRHRGLSCTVEPNIPEYGTNTRPAGCFCDGGMAAAGGCEWQPGSILDA